MGLRRATLVAWALLLLAGLYAASPFLTNRLVGTGEAYNYSLSVADALTQMRSGIVPPLAGQTYYAFNGRIHPLRDAPYLHYLAYAIDLATARRLPFWEVQNVSLALSIVAAAFACYAGLRWATGCSRPTATLLGALYVLAPPILCSAHSLNLFMTVDAAVFVPLAVAACVQGCRNPTFKHDLLLAAALAATWLAHPPVALWLTATTGALRLVTFLTRPTLRELVNGTVAVVAGALLASFVFASTATLSHDLGLSSNQPELWPPFAASIVSNLRSVFPASLLPVHRSGGESGDLQLGYFGYALLLVSLWQVVRGPKIPGRRTGILLFAAAVVLLVLLLPVPVIMPFAWKHFPALVYQVTTEWPIQRLYLILLALALFAAPLLTPTAGELPRWLRWTGMVAATAALAWTAYEAQAFVGRGFLNRRPPGETSVGYQPSNFFPTITSYAYLDTPPTYLNGVVDPAMEYRLLSGGTVEYASQMSAAATAPVTASGVIKFQPKEDVAASSIVRLQPGVHYLLTLNFLAPPQQGDFYVVGTWIHRAYALPNAGGPRAFGMSPGQPRSLTVWTDSSKPEEVQFKMTLINRAKLPPGQAEAATFTLQAIDQGKLPVQVDSSFPLRFHVDTPGLGFTVETPRRFILGYAATVNGAPANVLKSPTGSVMVAVPAGRSEVALDYPGPRIARVAFWVCAAAWISFAVAWLTGLLGRLDPWASAIRSILASGRSLSDHWVVAAMIVVVLAVLCVLKVRALQHERLLKAAGPIQVTFELPYGEPAQNQPLVVTGHVGEGVMVFVRLVDATHVLLGADVWGQLFQTAPFEIDYSQPHHLVVSDMALLPASNPQVKAMSKKEREYFGRSLRLELDGQTKLAQDCDTFTATPHEIFIGHAPFGSNTQPDFTGKILSTDRLPIPRRSVLPNAMTAELTVGRSAAPSPATGPLLTILKGANSRVLGLRNLSKTRARLSLLDGAGAELQGKDIAFAPDRAARISLSYDPPSTGGGLDNLNVTVDGAATISSQDLSAQEQVPILISGLNQLSVPGVTTRFTGAQLELALKSKVHLAPTFTSPATADLIVLFPTDRPGRHEPIVASGRSGAGDVIYVSYLDGKHVQFGLDHWNGAAATSPPIQLDYNVPHEIRITMAALVPPGQASPDAGVKVVVDGAEVIKSTASSYPTKPDEITFGHNKIGASTADQDFTGTILFLSRGGTASADGFGDP